MVRTRALHSPSDGDDVGTAVQEEFASAYSLNGGSEFVIVCIVCIVLDAPEVCCSGDFHRSMRFLWSCANFVMRRGLLPKICDGVEDLSVETVNRSNLAFHCRSKEKPQQNLVRKTRLCEKF